MEEKTQELRKHTRINLQSKVRLSHDGLGQFEALTSNLSDGGLLIHITSSKGIAVGDVLTVQSIDIQGDAPILPVKVLRVGEKEVAVEFIEIAD